MFTLDTLQREKRADIVRLGESCGVRNIQVFGSVVRGGNCVDSDVDFLVEMEKGRTLFDLAAFVADVQDLLGVRVDVFRCERHSPRRTWVTPGPHALQVASVARTSACHLGSLAETCFRCFGQPCHFIRRYTCRRGEEYDGQIRHFYHGLIDHQLIHLWNKWFLMTNIPVLCFHEFDTCDQLLRFGRTEGGKWRAKFRRKIKDRQYRLTEEKELFKLDGVCALYNAANLRVIYFSERLSQALPLMHGQCDIAAFQQIHDQVSAWFLPKTENKRTVQLPQFWILLLELLQNGFLGEVEAPQAAPVESQARFNRFTSLIILPSLSCNFHCDYCYHRGIARDRKSPLLLTGGKLRRGIDYFLANTSVPSNISRSIRFTGGEPMLHYGLIGEALEYVAEIRLRDPGLAPFNLSMVTNAALIDDQCIELIKKYGIVIAVSLDGRQPRNDLRRKSYKGSAYRGSTAGIQRLNEAGIQPTLFVTVSSHNIDTLAEDVTWLFENFQFAAFSFNLDTSFMPKYRVAPAEYTQGIINAYTKLGSRGLFDLKVTRMNDRFQSKRIGVSGCGGIFSHMALFPDGKIGPCPRMAGDPTQTMDLVDGQELRSSSLFRRWSRFDYLKNPKCQKCNYRNMCEGWCPYASMKLTGQISEPNAYNCLFTRTMLEWLIWADYARILRENN